MHEKKKKCPLPTKKTDHRPLPATCGTYFAGGWYTFPFSETDPLVFFSMLVFFFAVDGLGENTKDVVYIRNGS